MSYTKEQIENAIKTKGYVWFDSDVDYDLNIVGIRNSTTGNNVTNVFDDILTVSFKLNKEWQFYSWPFTTDPGKKAVLEFNNPNGVSRLVEGQYRNSHTIGLHQGKYKALKQLGKVKVIRDANKNLVFDGTKVDEGIFGINIHKAGADSTFVENWSEGCQVFKREADFNKFMAICEKAAELHTNKFTYTLIKSSDIK
jgi:hypothetical protein